MNDHDQATEGSPETSPAPRRGAAAPTDQPRFPQSLIRRQTVEILRAWGFDATTADVTAEVMTHTDLSGIDSHGVSMFMAYEALLHSGRLNPGASPTVVRENAATALMDAQAGLGHPAAVAGMDLACAKAAASGVGVVSVFNSHHFGAAGYYAALAARRGYVGLVTTSARTTAVLPAGGAEPRLSTNPIAFAAPARTEEPFLLDMSTSTVALNKIKVFDLTGRTLPEGWFLDRDGSSVTDAGEALRAARNHLGGGLTPLGGRQESGGHKGYGLSLMVQILSSALSGGSLSALAGPDSTGPDNIGHFLLALDPAVFRPEGGFLDDVDEILHVMHETPPAEPGGKVLVPGEPEERARAERSRDGIPLSRGLLSQLQQICARAKAPFMLGAGDVPGPQSSPSP